MNLDIIIPLFNEEKRLKNLFFEIHNFEKKVSKYNLNFIFINDGSKDNTLKILNNHKKKNFKFISYKKNLGKGFAIKKGILASKNDWILTCDADLSVKLEQILTWKRNFFLNEKCAYFGSRNLKTSKVKAIFLRRSIGYLMRLILKIFLNIQIKDTQCGYKLYHKRYIKKIIPKLSINGFAHDLEIYILLKRNNIEVKELPVSWKHKDGSKVNLFTDSFKFFISIFNLKIRYSLKT